ncbi:MAG: hypothetical protein RLZZ373_3297, partial [Pseudomonadota bacterium]
MPPASHILVVSDDLPRRDQIVAALNAAARPDDPVQLTAFASDAGEPALDAVRRDGDLHLVLIDHHDAADRSAVHLAQSINRLRPELSLYLMLEDDDTKLLVEELAGDAVDGYFFRNETDHAGWRRILAAEVAQTAATPFYDALCHYVAQAKDSWHTPGHAGGDSYKASPWVGDFHSFVGEQMLHADLSVSVPMLDSLLHPTGVILQAQRLAAQAFGARKTYFAT